MFKNPNAPSVCEFALDMERELSQVTVQRSAPTRWGMRYLVNAYSGQKGKVILPCSPSARKAHCFAKRIFVREAENNHPPFSVPSSPLVGPLGQDKGIQCDGFWITRWTQDHPREDREAMIGGCRSASRDPLAASACAFDRVLNVSVHRSACLRLLNTWTGKLY